MTNLNAYRFPLSELTLKPGKVSGQSALFLVYTDSRAYQDALDVAKAYYHGQLAHKDEKNAA